MLFIDLYIKIYNLGVLLNKNIGNYLNNWFEYTSVINIYIL